MTGSQQKETTLAIIERTAPHMIETRFKPGVRITMEGIKENILERATICGDEPHVMLTLVPPDTEFDMNIMDADVFAFDGLRARIMAIAMVVPDAMFSMVMKLYFSYFPQAFRTRVFVLEADARVWLDQQIVELVPARN